MMNGIDNIVRRHDLADRSIIINLAVIPEDKRIAEADFWREFEDDAPEILGATLDAVSCSLRKFRTIHLPRVPRMADFAIWVTAAEQALGWKDGTFLNAYAMNRREVNAMTLDADLVGTAVKAFMEGRGYETWEGTATELLNILDDESEERTKKSRGWPHSSNSLSGKLRRAATALRAEGIEITTGSDRKIVQDGEHKKQRFIRLEQVAKKIVPIVPGMDTNAQAIDFTENNCRTMLEDKIVPESFPRSGDRSRWDDVRDDRNDGRKKIVPETGKKRPVKTGGCKSGNDGDDGDDDFSPPFQNELREGII
jgi:hypothetical protein